MVVNIEKSCVDTVPAIAAQAPALDAYCPEGQAAHAGDPLAIEHVFCSAKHIAIEAESQGVVFGGGIVPASIESPAGIVGCFFEAPHPARNTMRRDKRAMGEASRSMPLGKHRSPEGGHGKAGFADGRCATLEGGPPVPRRETSYIRWRAACV
jgi:hypothetical protein